MKRSGDFRVRALTLALAALAAATFGGGALAQSVGECAPARTKYKTAALPVAGTSSMGFVNVPHSGIAFTQGGRTAGCVVVRFSAQALTGNNPGRAIFVQAVLDGAQVATPGAVRFAAGELAFAEARGFEWVFPSVAPGRHTLSIQYRSGNGGAVQLQSRTTIVEFQ